MVLALVCFIFVVFIFSYYLWEGKTDFSFEVMLTVSFLKNYKQENSSCETYSSVDFEKCIVNPPPL